MSPDVSVVIPTYNRRSMVQEAIESCLAGNGEIDVEVIVVDDGSTDGTRDYLAGINDGRVRPIFQEHQGAQVARNAGQQAARGRAIKHLDDDDYLLPGRLSQEYRRLRRSEAEVCFSAFHKHDLVNDCRWPQNTGYDNEHQDFFVALVSKSISRLQLALLFETSALSGIRWDESLPYLQDVNFMVKAASQGLRCVKLDHPVAVHRIHDKDRITDARAAADSVSNLVMKCEWYDEAFRRLQRREQATPLRRRATATGIWREAHKIAPFDWNVAQEWLRRALELSPTLQPDRQSTLLSTLDALVSPLFTEAAVNPLRRLRLRM